MSMTLLSFALTRARRPWLNIQSEIETVPQQVAVPRDLGLDDQLIGR